MGGGGRGTATTQSHLLPPEVPDFTGREEEIHCIENQAPGTVTLITGKPGVGKTSLAVHVAYKTTGTYADGNLYADLRGADEKPAAPEEVMARFIHALGIPEDEIPTDPHARLDKYRSVTANRCLIVVLDNAADESQVRPLCPPGGSAHVLVTSRSRLRGLEGATRIDLETFPSETAQHFLQRIIGQGAKDSNPEAIRAVVDACGSLPLALRIAANRLTSTPGMKVLDLAAELSDQRNILGSLEAGDLAVRAAFNLSYRRLGKRTKNAFKRLSLAPGEDFGPGVCSALIDCSEPEARRTLEKLSEVNLIESSSTYGRFRFHDLLKVYSREKNLKDSEAKRAASLHRMLEWFRNSSLRVNFAFIGKFGELEAPTKYYANIETVGSAITWARAELLNATAAISLSLEHEGPIKAEILAMPLCAICEYLGEWQVVEEVVSLGLKATDVTESYDVELSLLNARVNLARHRREFFYGLEVAEMAYARAVKSGNDFSISIASNLLGCLKMECGDLEGAKPLIEKGIEISRRLGVKNQLGQGLYNLGTVHRSLGNSREAINCFKQDLQVCIELGDELGTAETLNTIALVLVEFGEFEEAEQFHRRSLDKFERIGNLDKVSMVLNDLGIALRWQGRDDEALELHLRDIALSRSLGDISGAALAQSNAAEVLHALGRPEDAERLYLEAVSVFTHLGDSERLARTTMSQVPLLFSVGKVEEAANYSEAAIRYLLDHGEVRDAAAAHQMIAEQYLKVDMNDRALFHATEAIRIGESFSAPHFRAISYASAVRANLAMGNSSEAEKFFTELRSVNLASGSAVGELLEELHRELKEGPV
ncbi:ATP-binding protein [Streptomyces sp. NPDC057002]|uniref:ATP-binding protein n=1 Tax=Streptomyces sp. NPDC057002 TaxID=3345992 RepID=UPI00363F57CE